MTTEILPRQEARTDIEIDEDTRIGLRLTAKDWWQLIALIGSLMFGVWMFHLNAVSTLDRKNEERINQVMIRIEERDRLMRPQYPTWAEIRALRESDLKYFNERLDNAKDDIIREIRGSR